MKPASLYGLLIKPVIMAALAASIAFVIIACGGAGGGTQSAGGGIGGTGVSAGVISGFGSVFVNGIEFETTGSAISIDGVPNQTQGDLNVGMKVTITAQNNSALTIEYESEIKGNVESITSSSQFKVLGQIIKTDSTTVFDGITDTNSDQIIDANDLSGLYLKISGFFDSSGDILATFIKESTGVTDKVKGIVLNVDTNAETFEIKLLTVDYSTMKLQDKPTLQGGEFVEVEGTLNGNTLFPGATGKIEIESQSLGADPGDEAEVEGIILDFVSQNDFKVSGQKIDASNATFEHGTASDLADDVKVQAKGVMNSNGTVVIAEKIEFKSNSGSEFEEEGVVTDKDTQLLTITINGKIIHITPSTIMEDENDPTFSFSSIVPNVDDLEVDGFIDNNNDYIATKVEKE